jgi:hypothetical protein
MPRPQRLTPLNQYREHGNTRPPLDELGSIAAKLEEQHDPTYTARLALADVYIDLSMRDPANADGHNQKAATALNNLVDDIEYLETAGYERSFVNAALVLACAYLRRAELPRWLAAAQGQPPPLEYDALLTAAYDTVPLIPFDSNPRGRAMECVPLLLGARGLARGTLGWDGRLALFREDKRALAGAHRTTNWDVSISADNSAAAFDAASVKLQVAGRGDRGHGRHKAGGIVTINAGEHGFLDVESVITSCVYEQDGALPEGAPPIDLMDAAQLDDITSSIWNWVNQS